jgi:mitochondrial fission protein ELM1
MPHREGAPVWGAPVWVLADDRTGDVAQCLGVAEALGLPFAVKTIAYERLAVLHNLFRGPSLTGVTPQSRATLAPPWPRLVIACGRRTAPIARWIKRRSGAKVVQIMDPGAGGRADIDLFVVPTHDSGRLPAERTLRVLGAPHRVTPARLAEARSHWRSHWAHLPRPWLAVLVGGCTRRREFPPDLARQLGHQVSVLAGRAGGSALLTTSRRTGRGAERRLLSAVDEPRFVHRWEAGGDNPFLGMIGLADAVVVTGESTSMCTEATLCPGPVYIWSPPGWAADKHVRLHQELFEAGYARPLDGVAELGGWSHPPLNPAADVAAAIRERLL